MINNLVDDLHLYLKKKFCWVRKLAEFLLKIGVISLFALDVGTFWCMLWCMEIVDLFKSVKNTLNWTATFSYNKKNNNHEGTKKKD